MMVVFLDWKYYDVTNKYYKLMTTKKSWSSARSDCESAGGDLASVESYEENSFLQSLDIAHKGNTARAWIGGTSSDGSTWRWKDGAPWSYTNWRTNSEAGQAGKISFGSSSGNWNSDDGTSLLNSICKKS